jgi:hypothetical protein
MQTVHHMDAGTSITIMAALGLMSIGAGHALRRRLRYKERKKLPHQPVPDVSLDDVKRIIQRDFPTLRVEHVIAALGELDNRWNSARVQLAALKLANGSLKVLKKRVAAANQDWRDVVVAAEHPGYWKVNYKSTMSKDKRQRIVDNDCVRYRSWLRR